jgi:hypothetical protein
MGQTALRAKIGPDTGAPADRSSSAGWRRGRARRLWRVHRQRRERSMAGFSPQPSGTGPIFPISLSLFASRHPVCVTPRSWNSEKLAPVAARTIVNNRPSVAAGRYQLSVPPAVSTAPTRAARRRDSFPRAPARIPTPTCAPLRNTPGRSNRSCRRGFHDA